MVRLVWVFAKAAVMALALVLAKQRAVILASTGVQLLVVRLAVLIVRVAV